MRPAIDHDDLGNGETIEIRSNEQPGGPRSTRAPFHGNRYEPAAEPDWDFDTWVLNLLAAMLIGSAMGQVVVAIVNLVLLVTR